MSRLPENQYYIQFNFQKFLIDGTVDLVDDASQGIWLKLFFASLNYEDMGHFKVNGNPLSTNEIAKKMGRSKRKIGRALTQLLKVGLCEQLNDGTIIIPSGHINHFANNLHTKYNQNKPKVKAKCFQNENENGSLQPKNDTPYNKEKKNKEEKKESPLTPQGEFNKLSLEDQIIVQSLQKGELQGFMIAHYKNHNPSAWRYWEKHREDKSGPQCEIIPLRVSA